MNPVIQQMRSHRSIRQYTHQPIPDSLLRSLIESAQAAASSGFIQAYSIVQVTDTTNRKRLARAAGDQRWVEQAAEFLVICADLQRVDYCCRKASAGALEGCTEHFISATVDAALMAQNLMLAAESEGLGGVFIGGIRNDPQVVTQCLQLPELVYPVFGICLGWPDSNPEVKPRLPVQSILHRDVYHRSSVAQDVENYNQMMRDYYHSRSENQRDSNWSEQTAKSVQGKTREHMLSFLQEQHFLLK